MNEHILPPAEVLSDTQRADLATLLAEQYLPRNIQLLGERVLGAQAISDIIGNRPEKSVLAQLLVERMQQTARLADAVAILKTETKNGNLLLGLNHILAGLRLADLAGLQKNVQAPEDPFLSNDFVELYYPRVQRTVCAIALGDPQNSLEGTGFLIGPDLVLTNFHVVEKFLDVQQEDGKDRITVKPDCGEVFCFFDYLSPPSPRVPPDRARPHSSVMVKTVANNWLVRARRRLDNEGKPPFAKDAGDRYDYAVIRLERAVGSAPSSRSGGSLRGWLNLDSGVSFVDDVGSRIVVFQHPAGSQQLWDIGVYEKLDPSQTRIWYSVNTERGASGGPAVDKRGRLYALHNASVSNEDPDKKVNQGVRIDLILNDLKQDPAIALSPVVDDDPGYWTLSENIDDPQPIIGRRAFRESVVKMMSPNGDRILAVAGPKDSGRHFSVQLLRRIVGPGVPIVPFGPTDLRTLSPKAFVKALATDLALPNLSTIPDARPTESTSRSFSSDLPAWLAQQLATAQAEKPSRYPAWVVINATVPEGERLAWAEDLPDILSALMGPPDVAQASVDLPHLRWLLLGSSNFAFPPTRTTLVVDDLTTAANTNYADEFVNCMSLAWRSIVRTASLEPQMLKSFGNMFIKDAERDKKAIRAYLAEYVRRSLKEK